MVLDSHWYRVCLGWSSDRLADLIRRAKALADRGRVSAPPPVSDATAAQLETDAQDVYNSTMKVPS